MTGLLALLCIVLIGVIAVQIGRVTEMSAKIRGEEEVEASSNRLQANLLMIFMILFLIFCVVSVIPYKNWMLGYGPHESASAHGKELDSLFNVTLFFTGIVFFVTQILLFYYSWKYQARKGRKAKYLPHDDTVEIIWTVIPAVVMCFLVVRGLIAWNNVMADVDPTTEEVIEIEATGYQFAWQLRYPGDDGRLGTRDYRLINGTNPLGQDWSDLKNADDFHPDEIVLPKGKKVRVRITARDVLHNFYLPHFRVKMDAIPGLPTYFVFTPEKTTEEYRMELRKYPEYQALYDESDPELGTLWENFNYELACAELCGSGHYSMKRVVRIVEQDEYEAWLKDQKSYYFSQIRDTDEDPYKGQLLASEIAARKVAFDDSFTAALNAKPDADERTIRFKYVYFRTGAANLTPLSSYELDNLAEALKSNPEVKIALSGHTDNTGDPANNMLLSQARADAVYNYLISKGIAADRMTSAGYGQTQPIADNADEEGRALNRRTQFRITAPVSLVEEVITEPTE